MTGDTSLLARWDAEDNGVYTILTMQLQDQSAFTEIKNHAQDAVEYFCLKKVRFGVRQGFFSRVGD